MKTCKYCGITKDVECFRKNRNKCKDCEKEYKKEYSKLYREKHVEELKQYQKRYREENKEVLKQKQKDYYKKYYEKNKEKILLKNKIWEENNKEKKEKSRKEWEVKNHDIILEKKLKRRKERLKSDPIYKLKTQSRDMIKKSFRGVLKGKRGHTTEILGCELDYFIQYLLETYKNNYGVEWDEKEKVHIDHIIPLSTAKTKEDVIKLCHYTNLQLLKAKDNLQKNNKLDWSVNNGL